MEIFKKVLKTAITRGVEAIRFQAGDVPVLIQASSETTLNQVPAHSPEALSQLIKTLLPHIEAVNPEQPVQGELSIVSFGDVKLIGQLGTHPLLFLFIPPQGNALFQQVWHQLTNEEDAHEAIALSNNEDYEADDHDHDQQPDIPPLPEADGSYSNDLGDPEDQPDNPFSMSAANEHSGIREIPMSEANQLDQGYRESFQDDEDDNYQPDTAFQPDFSSVSYGNEEETSVFDEEGPDAAYESPYHDSDHSVPSQIEQPQEINYLRTAVPNQDDHRQTIINSRSHQQELVTESHRTPGELTLPNAAKQQTIAEIVFGPFTPGESLPPWNGKRPIDDILHAMVESGASDLHLTLNQPVCLRVDGDIQRMQGQSVSEDQMKSLLLPIIPEKNRSEFTERSDTDFAYEVKGLARFRVNMFRDINGVGAVLRQIPDRVLTAEELNLPDPIRNLCSLSKGLVLVTGPTGSGKSTTLAAMLDLINSSRREHILTIEDPIEFVHKQKLCLINQREVHRHTSSFSKALRAALREDPDIILIGEMRDLETVAIAIETAETGHLVFGTLHTNTAISTVDRLIDQFPADQQEQIRVMLAESLKGVVSQTLVKRKQGGRVAAHEILIVDRAVASLIREANSHMIQNQMQTQKAKGNLLLNESLFNLVSNHVVSAEDAYAKAIDKESFRKLLEQRGIRLELSA